MSVTLPVLRLRRHEDRRVRQGHPWIYSNEVDPAAAPVTSFAPGSWAVVESAAAEPLGTAYVNPHSLICARMVSVKPNDPLDRAGLTVRLGRAAALRERLFPEPFYRLAFGESDGLPGLVVDRYGSVLVVQMNTAGMEQLRMEILEVLTTLFAPTGILLRNDSATRTLEGLERVVEVAQGEVPEQVALTEGDARFLVPLLSGQKTGWFFDQRGNRNRMGAYVRGARVLDLYGYLGAWGIQAANHGAREVVIVDSSRPAMEHAQEHAVMNGCAARIRTEVADVPEFLKAARGSGAPFDVVILDPPAFIRRRKDVAEGLAAYRRVNQLAAQVLADDGILISSSCSYHLERGALWDAVYRAGRRRGATVQMLEEGGQGPDHPVHPAIPETAYLKTLFARLVPS